MKIESKEHIMTTFEIAGNFMIILRKVLKSFLFNLLMFILGFGCAYVYVVTTIHHRANCSDTNAFISQIENDVQQQKSICRKIEAQLRDFRLKVSHDADPICDDCVARPFIPKDIRDEHK